MSNECVENEVCEACGCAAEMGFIIKEGDEFAEVTIMAPSGELLEAELAKYVALAKEVSNEVQFEHSEIQADSTQLSARFKFEVSAEKLIFELKTRSLAR